MTQSESAASREQELLADGLWQRIDDPIPRWLLSRPFMFYVPTQFVFEKPELAVPVQGRYWATGCYMYEGRILPYNEIVTLQSFRGTNDYTAVYLYEVWEHYGDDGHTDPRLMYWTLTPGKVEDPLQIWRRVEYGEVAES